ncbi:MAG: lipocalin family protein [Vicinamibacterales bacterium]
MLVAVAAAVVVAAATAMINADTTPLRVVPDLDYKRYAGRWYEIARLPNRFEKKCVGNVTATYTLRSDGRVTVTNRCKESNGSTSEATGIARRVEGKPPSVLQVRFAPAFLSFIAKVWGDYHVMELGPQYDYSVVGSPDRRYLWVLARTPRLDSAIYQSLVDRAKAQGFDTSTLIQTPQ